MNIRRINPGGGVQWIIQDVLACGERPGFPSHTVAARVVDQWLEEARRQGIRSAIILLSEDELAVYYRHIGQPLAEYYADAGLEVRQISHEDLGVPVTKRVMLDRVRTAFEVLPKPVLVHCSEGIERSRLAIETICRAWRTRAKKRPVSRR